MDFDIAEFDSRLNVLKVACLVDYDVQVLGERTRWAEKLFEDDDIKEMCHDLGEMDVRLVLLERMCRVDLKGRMWYLHDLIGEAMDRIDWMAQGTADLAPPWSGSWSGSSTPPSSSTASDYALPCSN